MIAGIPEETIDLIARIILASFLGGLIGLERDIHGRAAGLRTHLLVSMGAAVFMLLSELIASVGSVMPEGVAKISDPGRIAAQVVTGIGFLGAGAIIKEGINIRGLTTAACLWVAAGIGMASGAGCYVLAISATILALFSLVMLKYFEDLYPKDSYRVLTVVTKNDVDVSTIIGIIKSKKLDVIDFDFSRNYDTGATTTKISIRLFLKSITNEIFNDVLLLLEQSDIPLKLVRWGHMELGTT